MDKIIFEQKEVMEAKKIELKRINEELRDISREISYFSGELTKNAGNFYIKNLSCKI